MKDNLSDIFTDPRLRKLIECEVLIQPQKGKLVDFSPELPANVARGLEETGIHSLYGHQRESFDRIMMGENVVVSTPAASGKSLCYLLPLLSSLHTDSDATALLLFPTKALGRDQEAKISELIAASGLSKNIATYDGDTPKEQRKTLRTQGGIIITNPDMLHAAILPRHTAWSDMFSTLKYIVIDEIHQYRGVFGSHVANVFRRLGRILDFYGSQPRWIAASATIGNPLKIAEALTGRRFHLVDRAAAPSPGRKLYIVNTPLVDARSGVRQSCLKLSARLALKLIKANLQTIVFANSRSSVEMLVRFIRNEMKESGHSLDAVKGYRGGYLPGLRREIEGELKSGLLKCVVATSALELGIDIGRLDAVVLAGYPGTISGLWQRVGRVGRRRKTGIAVLVAGGSPLDQFLVKHPGYITESNPESCCINPDNLEILVPHIKCAISEIPFTEDEPFALMKGDEMKEILDFLTTGGETNLSGDRYFWISSDSPARDISLRTAGGERFNIIEEQEGKVIEEIEKTRVLRSLHPKAIYQHAGAQYEVTEIDYDAAVVRVRETNGDTYTEPVTEDRLSIIDEYDSGKAGSLDVCLGEIRITQKVVGFKCIKYYTNEIISAHETDLPEQEMDSFSLWLKVRSNLFNSIRILEKRLEVEVPQRVKNTMAKKHPVSLMLSGLKGLGYLMCKIGALRLMCDPKDLASSVSCDFSHYLPGCDDALGYLYIYELYQGGVGIARGFYESFADIAGDCMDVVRSCRCKAGCPSCVNPPGGKEDLRKTSSIILLDTII